MRDSIGSNGFIKREVKEGVDDFREEKMDDKRKLFERLESMLSDFRNPEEFFVVGRYELIYKFEEIILKISSLAFKKLKEGEFEEVLSIGREVLDVIGVSSARMVSVQSPSGVVALTEAINWASKTISQSLYSLKPLMIVSASKVAGVDFGYGDDGAYYLGNPGIGVASFHDPDDEVGYIFAEILKEKIPIWEYPWSGVSREEDSFKILESLTSKDLNNGLARLYADATSPPEIREARRKYMEGVLHGRLVALGDVLRKSLSADSLGTK